MDHWCFWGRETNPWQQASHLSGEVRRVALFQRVAPGWLFSAIRARRAAIAPLWKSHSRTKGSLVRKARRLFTQTRTRVCRGARCYTTSAPACWPTGCDGHQAAQLRRSCPSYLWCWKFPCCSSWTAVTSKESRAQLFFLFTISSCKVIDTCLIEKSKDRLVSHHVNIEYRDRGMVEDCPLPTRGLNERLTV